MATLVAEAVRRALWRRATAPDRERSKPPDHGTEPGPGLPPGGLRLRRPSARRAPLVPPCRLVRPVVGRGARFAWSGPPMPVGGIGDPHSLSVSGRGRRPSADTALAGSER